MKPQILKSRRSSRYWIVFYSCAAYQRYGMVCRIQLGSWQQAIWYLEQQYKAGRVIRNDTKTKIVVE